MIQVGNAPCSWGVLEFETAREAAGYTQVLDEIKDEAKATLAERFEGREKEISAAVRAVTKKVIRQRILTDGFRIDGRGLVALSPTHSNFKNVFGFWSMFRRNTALGGVYLPDGANGGALFGIYGRIEFVPQQPGFSARRVVTDEQLAVANNPATQSGSECQAKEVAIALGIACFLEQLIHGRKKAR